jgi:hypothetical protein
MEKETIVRAVVMWFLFLPVPVINGALRENWYKQKIGELKSNHVGGVVLSVTFLLYTFLFFKNEISGFSLGQLLELGFLWLAMTFVFECGIGLHAKRSWGEIFAEYNVFTGKVWSFVMLIIFLSPLLISLMLKS